MMLSAMTLVEQLQLDNLKNIFVSCARVCNKQPYSVTIRSSPTRAENYTVI